MYRIIKKNLLVIAILALPVMNSGVMAMDDYEYSEEYSRYYAPQCMEEEQIDGDEVSYGQRVVNNASGLLGAILSNRNTAIAAGVVFQSAYAAACYCVCWPDPMSLPTPKVIGECFLAECKMTCASNGYWKNFTCK